MKVEEIIAAILMALFAIWVACSMTSCATPRLVKHNNIARITFYNKHEDKYGSRVASRRGHARVASTCAAETCCYPFGTRIYIPRLAGIVGNGRYVVEDRGSAVEKRRASHGICPVFDIYAGTRRQMKRWACYVPPYLEYEIQ